MRIPQPGAFASHDHNRFALEPIAHLGERVPKVTMIQFGKRVHKVKVRSPKFSDFNAASN